MKVLIVSQYFWPENFRINDVAVELANRGCEVEVLTGKPNYPKGIFFEKYSFLGKCVEFWGNIKISRIPILPRGKGGGIRLFINYLSFIFFGALFAPLILRKVRYDIIFVYAPSPIFQVIPALLLGRIRRVPVVLWVQDLWPESLEATGYIKKKLTLDVIRYFVKLTYCRVDLILVQSKAFFEPVRKLAQNVPIKYYPNSVDKIFYDFSECVAPNFNAFNSGFNLLFAGNVGLAQSMDTILAAASRLDKYPEIKVIILGDGSRLDWLKKEIKSRDLRNVVVGGRYPIETMPYFMRKASVLLVSLTADPIFSLTVPNKIQAYLAVGRPIIASLNGEGARLIEEANAGIAVPAEDYVSLANAIIKMYKMTQDQRDKLAENGRKFFKANFDEDFLIDALILNFENLISKEKD